MPDRSHDYPRSFDRVEDTVVPYAGRPPPAEPPAEGLAYCRVVESESVDRCGHRFPERCGQSLEVFLGAARES